MVTCLGGAEATVKAIMDGTHAASPQRSIDQDKVHLTHSYQRGDGPVEARLRPNAWLAEAVAGAVRDSGVHLAGKRVAVIVGTGLRQLRDIERWHVDGEPM